ncbi:MAG TPA: ABC transporter ATP-binding protein [Rhodospirillales bacterium]|nr:ABC transporter ATP-binding protein [Rhodospirillales bacterium]
MLRVENLSRPGLEPASLTIGAGECVALSGPSGAGKTLLLRAIADLDPNRGVVSLNGESRESMPAPHWRRKVAYLPAESGWWSEKVGEHFLDMAAAVPLIERLGLGAGAADWPVARLSTGERQRLALARALALTPLALLLDEPTSGLDPEATARVEELLAERLGEGASMLLVSHDARQAGRFAERSFSMKLGRLAETGP